MIRLSTGCLLLTILAALACIIPACHTPSAPRSPFSVGVSPRPLSTSSVQGNEYEIEVAANTNRPDWPTCNVGPAIPRRVHIQLSTDGGTTFGRYIAYGVPVISHGSPVTNRSVSYTYSIPWWDESLITESAVLRVTDLEGEEMGRSIEPFTIAGLFWHSPAAGSTLTHGTLVDLEWVQSGVGSTAELGWLTPSNDFTVVAVVSNLVPGVNQLTWSMSGVPYPRPQIKLALRSVSDPKVHGQTGSLATE